MTKIIGYALVGAWCVLCVRDPGKVSPDTLMAVGGSAIVAILAIALGGA